MKSFSTFRHTALMAAMLLLMPAAHAMDTQSLVASKMSAVSSQENDTYDRFIVSYREGSGIRNNPSEVTKDIQFAITASGVDRMASRSGEDVEPLTVAYKRKLGIGAELVQTSRKLDMAEANALMQKIAANPDVVYIQPDRKLPLDDVNLLTFPSLRSDALSKASVITPLAFTPNDPYYNNYQWNFYAPGSGSANINNAWDLADGEGVTVAVIDSGLAPNPDIDDTWVCDGYNFVSTEADKCGRDPGYTVGESSWHGTKVAGIINAKTNNGIGLAGVAYKARLVPIRAGANGEMDISAVVDAIEWVSGGQVDGVESTPYPAQVINMSFGSAPGVGNPCETYAPALAEAIRRAVERDVVLVASAGNTSSDGTVNNHIPSTCPGVIAVAATDYFGNRAAVYSNYGAAVALAAPVGGASSGDFWEFSWLLSNSSKSTPNPDGEPYIVADAGTSFAAPLVTGSVALMISARQKAGLTPATPARIKEWLVSSTRNFPRPPDHPIGSGILDAHAAVVKALSEE